MLSATQICSSVHLSSKILKISAEISWALSRNDLLDWADVGFLEQHTVFFQGLILLHALQPRHPHLQLPRALQFLSYGGGAGGEGGREEGDEGLDIPHMTKQVNICNW